MAFDVSPARRVREGDHQEPPERYIKRRGRDARKRVELVNDVVIVAADAANYPASFSSKSPSPRYDSRRCLRGEGREERVSGGSALSLFCGERANFYNSVIAEVPEEVGGWGVHRKEGAQT